MSHRPGTENPSTSASPLGHVIDDLAHLLPAQGPISIFIHHNTLHAFEEMPFEEAVERGAARFGCEPFLSEARYRTKLVSGRILAKDVESILAEELGSRGSDQIADVGTRLDLWRRIVLHGVPAASGRALSWLLEETSVLSSFRTDVPRDARQALSALSEGEDPTIERKAVRQLWDACLNAVERTPQTRT